MSAACAAVDAVCSGRAGIPPEGASRASELQPGGLPAVLAGVSGRASDAPPPVDAACAASPCDVWTRVGRVKVHPDHELQVTIHRGRLLLQERIRDGASGTWTTVVRPGGFKVPGRHVAAFAEIVAEAAAALVGGEP